MELTTSGSNRALAATLAASLCLLIGPRPASADGAASTRNIIFGAAAVGGTLLILNHNKKVHQKYAEYDRRQAQTQSEANHAQAAYEAERSAYAHEAALVSEYQKETSYQHAMIKSRDAQIATLRRSLQVAKTDGTASRTFAQATNLRAPMSAPAHAQVASAQLVSYGWGSY